MMNPIFSLGILLLCILSQALTTGSNAISSSTTKITKSSPSEVISGLMTSSHVINTVSSSTSYPSHTSSQINTVSIDTVGNSEAYASSSTQIADSVTKVSVQVSPSVTTEHILPNVTSVIAQENATTSQAGGNVTLHHINSTHIAEFTTVAATPTAGITKHLTLSPSNTTTSVTRGLDSSSPALSIWKGTSPTATTVTSPSVTKVIHPSNASIVFDNVTSTALPVTQLPTVSSTAQLPTESLTAQVPSVSPTTELPPKASTKQLPTVSPTTQLPTVLSTTELPTVVPTTQLPTTTRLDVKPRIKSLGDEPTVPVEVKEGEPMTLECEIQAGYPTPTIAWYKDRQTVENAIFIGNNNSTLVIEKTSRDDAGKYTCIATNRAGKDMIVFEVKIHYFSDIDITFSADRVYEGSTVTITCAAKSSPRPLLSWKFKKGIPGSSQKSEGNQFYTTNLTLINVNRKNAGTYTCVGYNKIGMKRNASKVLEVLLSAIPTYPPATKLRITHKTIELPIHKIKFLKNGQEVNHIQIVVFELQGETLPKKSPSEYGLHELRPFKGDRSVPYVAAVFKLNDSENFVIGNGRRYPVRGRVKRNVKEKQEYYNVPLRPDKFYTAFQRLIANDSSSFEALPWISPIKTKSEPVTDVEEDNTGLIIGIVIGLIILIILLALVVKYFVKNHSQSAASRNKYEMNGISPLGKMARTFSMHMARIGEHYHTPEPIPVEDFPHHVARMHKSGDMLFSTEYERIRDDNNIPATHCLDPSNQWKNRYTNIVAYDHNRVKLVPFDDEPASDYINASYIDGYQGITYIAAQGPLDETCGDFWRMIWEQNTRVVVMLTNVRERGRLKCTQYWPTSGYCKFEAAHISLEEEVELTSHTIRVFRVSMAPYDETRVIKQFHFTSWPDHGVPKSVAFLLAFVREADKVNPPNAGPMVVHCSAGVGRTGTFIVIDTMLKKIANERTVDIFHYVTQLRKQRNLMVQTEQQYIFTHDALLDAIVSGDTEIPVNRLRQHIEEMMEQDKEGETKLTNEFLRLTRGVRPHLQRSAATHSSNKRKNRYANALPYDETRVPLSVEVAVTGSDYINASYIDGYRKKRAYIATQAPLPQTFVDFWKMIWEQDCCTIVTLAQEVENTKPKMDRYWPTLHPITYGNLEVEFLEEEKKELFDIRVFKIKNIQDETSRTIHQYHYMNWTSEDIDDSGSFLLAMIDTIQQWQDASGNHVITVHCSAGVGRTGVFCAVKSLIERLKAEALIDVFTTVKLLREQRPAMVQTKIQYEYCYRVILQYLDINKSLEERSSPCLDVVLNITTVTEPKEKEKEEEEEEEEEEGEEEEEEEGEEEEKKEGEEEEEIDHVIPAETKEDIEVDQTNTPEETEQELKENDTQEEENSDADVESETDVLQIDPVESDPHNTPVSSSLTEVDA